MSHQSRAEVLDAARIRAGLALEELWIRYYALGGTATLHEMMGFLCGRGMLTTMQYDVIAQALNDELLVQGADHSVPYAEEFPSH